MQTTTHRIRQVTKEAEALFRRLQGLSTHAHTALDEGDVDAVIAALIEREAAFEEIERRVKLLLDARATVGGGAASPEIAAEIERAFSVLGTLGRDLLSSDDHLFERVEIAYKAIARELDELGTTAAGTTAYNRVPSLNRPRLDYLR